jgi:hypothetical protein
VGVKEFLASAETQAGRFFGLFCLLGSVGCVEGEFSG